MNREAEGNGAQALSDKIEQLIHEGNVRRIIVRDRTGRTVLDLPVFVGVVAAAMMPMITMACAAIGLVGGWTIDVERKNEASPSTKDSEASNGQG